MPQSHLAGMPNFERNQLVADQRCDQILNQRRMPVCRCRSALDCRSEEMQERLSDQNVVPLIPISIDHHSSLSTLLCLHLGIRRRCQALRLLQINSFQDYFMIYSKQLYQTTSFHLPEIGSISLHPFPQKNTEVEPDTERDECLKKVYAPQQQQFEAHCGAYLSEFQQICAKQNLYPFMIKTGISKFAVVCRECILLCDWRINEKGAQFEGGDNIVKIEKYQKIKIAEIPTAIHVGTSSMFVGYQTGRVSQYLFRTRSWQGVSDDLQFPVMQIQAIKQEQNKESSVLVIDSAGNIATISFSHKTFMDKIIKTLVSLKWVSFLFRNKKREKIKKIFQNLISKQKESNQTQSSSSQTVNQTNLYYYNRFHLKQIRNDIILTVYRKNRLQILVLNKLYELTKTIYVDCFKLQQVKQDIAFIELGQGGFEKSNIKHHILVIGINKSILFFRLLEIEDSYQALFISEIISEEKILFGTFVSNSLLLLGTSKNIMVQNVNEQPREIMSYDKSKFSYVDFFIDQQKMEMDQKLFNQYLFAILQEREGKDKKFVCLQGKRLIAGCIYSWQSLIYKQIQEQRWEKALICYEQIYNGVFRLCCEIKQEISQRNEQMKSICKVIIMGYLHNKQQTLKNPSKQRNYIINNTIYFLLKCDQNHLLFHQIQSFFAANQLQDNFLNELSHYIEEKDGYQLKIPYISEKILNRIIRKYKILQQQYILQRLFMRFDLNQMQKLILLTTCLREQLYQSLIYICCEQKDYITPIIKLCGIRLTNPQKKQRIADIIYWYLSECLLGRLTDYGNEADYINMLAILINFIFIPSSLEMLLQTSHAFLIQIINMFFQPRILRHILENEQKFFMRKGEEGDPIFEQSCLKEYKLYEKMLSILIKVIQNSPTAEREVYQLELNRFLTSIMVKNQFPFLPSIKIKIILFYINHPFIFLQKYDQNITEQNQIYMNGHLMRLLDSLVRSISQKCLYIRQKAKFNNTATEQIQELMAKSKSLQLSKILQAIMISQYNMQFSQTKCYIHHELGNYSEVMETYLKMTNKKIRIRIYQYLDNNIREYEKLTQQFLKYMISLLNIDQKKTAYIIQKLRQQWVNQQQIIDKLVEFPTIQLDYIEKVIHNGNEKSKKLLLRHLEIVLRQKSQQIQYFINKIDYPLQQAFRMCEQSNNRKGKAFILIKSGRNMQGVLIIAQIFLQSIQQYLRGLFKKVEYDKQKKDRIMGQFKVVLSTCHKQWSIDNDRGQQIWQKITEIIFKKMNINNIDSQHIPESIRSILNEIVYQLLSTMLEQVSTDFFLNRFVKTFNSLPLRIFTLAYKFIYQRIQFTFTLQKLNKDLLQSNQVSLWNQIMQSIFHGHVCNLMCNICSNAITNHQRMVTYLCGHIFHQQCYYQHNNKKNKNELCPLCYNSIDSFMICSDQKLPRYRLQIDQQQLLKHKINKMNYYDRTTLMSAMQNWSKYEQWVDI